MLRLHQLVVTLDDYPKLDEQMLKRLCAARLKVKEDRIAQVKCPKCGTIHDMDYPKCPYCGHDYR